MNTHGLRPRSVLCTPALATTNYVRARHCGADVGLVDLEDSVPPEHKQSAREVAARYFALNVDTAAIGGQAVRINAPTCLDGMRDLLALTTYHPAPDIILVPKAESAHDIALVARIMAEAGATPHLWALIETPRGISAAAEIAAADHLTGVAFGAADYARAAGCTPEWESLVYARAQIVAAAAASGVVALDSPYFDMADLDGLHREAQAARALGFGGKVAIHPTQVPVINTVFSPTPAQIAHARAVLAAEQAIGGRITVVDGQMVGPPFFAAARALLAEFDSPATTPTNTNEGAQ